MGMERRFFLTIVCTAIAVGARMEWGGAGVVCVRDVVKGSSKEMFSKYGLR